MSEPVLLTPRLSLWQPAREDIDPLHTLTEPADMRRHLGAQISTPADSFQRTLRNAGSWSLFGYGLFVVRERGSGPRGAVVGSCGVFHSWRGFAHGLDDVPEAGWVIAQAHWGQGLAREAMDAVLAWFDAEHDRQRIAAMIARGNARSHALARALGFVRYARHVEDEDSLVLYERL